MFELAFFGGFWLGGAVMTALGLALAADEGHEGLESLPPGKLLYAVALWPVVVGAAVVRVLLR